MVLAEFWLLIGETSAAVEAWDEDSIIRGGAEPFVTGKFLCLSPNRAFCSSDSLVSAD